MNVFSCSNIAMDAEMENFNKLVIEDSRNFPQSRMLPSFVYVKTEF